jgi:L-fuconolactonase
MVVWAPADLGADAVGRQLDTLDLSTVRGVRRLIQGDPPGLCTQRPFVESVVSLASRDLVFDVCIFPRHLDDAIELADRAPGTRLVLDHVGKPDIAGGGFDDWHAGFRELAAHDNVWCTLSGLVTEADTASWTVDDLRPVVDAALAAFGPQRLLWGSDWPVVTLAATHRRWREATGELLGELSPDERDAIRSTTAIEVYGLNEETP